MTTIAVGTDTLEQRLGCTRDELRSGDLLANTIQFAHDMFAARARKHKQDLGIADDSKATQRHIVKCVEPNAALIKSAESYRKNCSLNHAELSKLL